MAASCFSMVTTQVMPSLEATAVTALGGGSACLKAPCSRLPMMALPTAAPCHSGISHARHGISCLTPVLGRRRVLRIISLAQDSPVAAEVVEEAQDIPLVQAEEEVEKPPPASGVSEGKESEEQMGGIQAVQEEESDVAIGTESKAEQETVEDQDYPPLPEGTKLYVGNIPFDVDSEGLAKMFNENGVVERVEEARGLDAGPRIVQKLVGLGDNRTSNIVKRIAEEEITHVAMGVSWFLTVCRKMGCMPDKTFTELLEELDVELKGPFNYEARAEAGMPRDWYDTSNLGLSRWDNHLDVENDKERMILQDVSTEQAHCNPHKFPVSDEGIKTTDFDLSKVYERLACIVAMEKENSEL